MECRQRLGCPRCFLCLSNWWRGMRVKKSSAVNKPDLVSSFIIAFTGEAGAFEGVCIKYAMHNGTFRLSYFDEQWFRALYQCVEYYSGTRYYGSDMQRAADEPEFVARLPRRHPVHTMTSKKPSLKELDYGIAKHKFCVTSLKVTDQGDRCRFVCTYADGSRRAEVLPGYIVMNLCGYLKACLALSGLMTLSPGGSA